jgi:hypothetical protein
MCGDLTASRVHGVPANRCGGHARCPGDSQDVYRRVHYDRHCLAARVVDRRAVAAGSSRSLADAGYPDCVYLAAANVWLPIDPVASAEAAVAPEFVHAVPDCHFDVAAGDSHWEAGAAPEVEAVMATEAAVALAAAAVETGVASPCCVHRRLDFFFQFAAAIGKMLGLRSRRAKPVSQRR